MVIQGSVPSLIVFIYKQDKIQLSPSFYFQTHEPNLYFQTDANRPDSHNRTTW